MAKGNDGNYFQHSIEVAAAVQLAATDSAGRLHVVLAHGVAPFEPCEESRIGQARSTLERTLSLSYRPAETKELPIVTAYRATGATFKRYPNSAELFRHVVGAAKLSGGIAEVDRSKYEQLANAWKDSLVVPINASWRSQLGHGGVLACPAALEKPWLFTLDPMTYREDGETDDNNLYRADLTPLSATLQHFVQSGKPGVAALFVYAVRPDVRPLFWGFASDLASRVGVTLISCWMAHQGGNRNLAALFCSAFEFGTDFPPSGIIGGRE